MKEIQYDANYYEPNIRILKNYIITFHNNLVILYDLIGNKLDEKKLLFDDIFSDLYTIYDICIINDNHLIAFAKLLDICFIYFSISINNQCFGKEYIVGQIEKKLNILFI